MKPQNNGFIQSAVRRSKRAPVLTEIVAVDRAQIDTKAPASACDWLIRRAETFQLLQKELQRLNALVRRAADGELLGVKSAMTRKARLLKAIWENPARLPQFAITPPAAQP